MWQSPKISFVSNRVKGRRGRTEERDSLPSVKQTMVVRERDDHDRADHDLAVHDDRALLDRMHACERGRGTAALEEPKHTRRQRSLDLGLGAEKLKGGGAYRVQQPVGG